MKTAPEAALALADAVVHYDDTKAAVAAAVEHGDTTTTCEYRHLLRERMTAKRQYDAAYAEYLAARRHQLNNDLEAAPRPAHEAAELLDRLAAVRGRSAWTTLCDFLKRTATLNLTREDFAELNRVGYFDGLKFDGESDYTPAETSGNQLDSMLYSWHAQVKRRPASSSSSPDPDGIPL